MQNMIFEPERLTINELFDGKTKYIIPDYQRPFSWVDDQLSELFEDIFNECFNNYDNHYFLGSMVIVKESKSKLITICGSLKFKKNDDLWHEIAFCFLMMPNDNDKYDRLYK